MLSVHQYEDKSQIMKCIFFCFRIPILGIAAAIRAPESEHAFHDCSVATDVTSPAELGKTMLMPSAVQFQ